jgi:hypothetical protein
MAVHAGAVAASSIASTSSLTEGQGEHAVGIRWDGEGQCWYVGVMEGGKPKILAFSVAEYRLGVATSLAGV